MFCVDKLHLFLGAREGVGCGVRGIKGIALNSSSWKTGCVREGDCGRPNFAVAPTKMCTCGLRGGIRARGPGKRTGGGLAKRRDKRDMTPMHAYQRPNRFSVSRASSFEWGRRESNCQLSFEKTITQFNGRYGKRKKLQKKWRCKWHT